jgi:hypothetical protein
VSTLDLSGLESYLQEGRGIKADGRTGFATGSAPLPPLTPEARTFTISLRRPRL